MLGRLDHLALFYIELALLFSSGSVVVGVIENIVQVLEVEVVFSIFIGVSRSNYVVGCCYKRLSLTEGGIIHPLSVLSRGLMGNDSSQLQWCLELVRRLHSKTVVLSVGMGVAGVDVLRQLVLSVVPDGATREVTGIRFEPEVPPLVIVPVSDGGEPALAVLARIRSVSSVDSLVDLEITPFVEHFTAHVESCGLVCIAWSR